MLLPNANRLSIGDNKIIKTSPNKPVSQTSLLRTVTIVAILFLSPVEFAAATFFIELVSNPKLVIPEINPIVVLNKPSIPIPAGPSKTAIIFDRIMLIKIENTCTPPKIDVAFIIWRYEDCCSVIYREKALKTVQSINNFLYFIIGLHRANRQT